MSFRTKISDLEAAARAPELSWVSSEYTGQFAEHELTRRWEVGKYDQNVLVKQVVRLLVQPNWLPSFAGTVHAAFSDTGEVLVHLMTDLEAAKQRLPLTPRNEVDTPGQPKSWRMCGIAADIGVVATAVCAGESDVTLSVLAMPNDTLESIIDLRQSNFDQA